MSDPNSKREGALRELRGRLQQITTANGYSCDAGLVTSLGEAPKLGPDDADAGIAIILGDSTEEQQGFSPVYLVTLPVSVQAFVRADLADPFLAAEALVGDIKRATELAEDQSMGGWCTPTGHQRRSVRPMQRAEGSEFVGLSVEYDLVFEERWGKP